MRHRRRRLHPDLVVIASAIAGVGALHAAALLAAPPLVALGDAPQHAGQRVAIEGLVLDVAHGARGRSLTLADAGWRLTILAPPGDGPERGDTVRAIGVMDTDRLSAERVDVVAPAATRILDPSDLARWPSSYQNARVLVRGELKAGPALAANGARVALGGEAPPASSGWWLASGTFYYHEQDASYRLGVDAWTSSS